MPTPKKKTKKVPAKVGKNKQTERIHLPPPNPFNLHKAEDLGEDIKKRITPREVGQMYGLHDEPTFVFSGGEQDTKELEKLVQRQKRTREIERLLIQRATLVAETEKTQSEIDRLRSLQAL